MPCTPRVHLHESTDYLLLLCVYMYRMCGTVHVHVLIIGLDQVMVRGVEESLMMKTVVPQLTKLARDSEM